MSGRLRRTATKAAEFSCKWEVDDVPCGREMGKRRPEIARGKDKGLGVGWAAVAPALGPTDEDPGGSGTREAAKEPSRSRVGSGQNEGAGTDADKQDVAKRPTGVEEDKSASR